MIVVPFDDEHTAQQHADTYRSHEHGRVTWNQHDLWWSVPLELSIHDVVDQMTTVLEGERMRARAKHPSGRAGRDEVAR